MGKKNVFSLSQSERDALMEQVYGGYVRSPEIQTWGRGSEWNPRHRNAGQIDFAAYGGKANNFSDQRALDSLERSKKKGFGGDDYQYEGKREYYGDAWRNRDTWGKVAKHLGIDKIDDETDLRQMYDFVQGYSAMEKEDKNQKEEPVTPPTFNPSDELTDAADDLDNLIDHPMNTMPRMDETIDMGNNGQPTSDPYVDAITHGDDLNDWYAHDTKRRVAEANLAGLEIGERTRFHANRFDGKVSPGLGDGFKLYEKYANLLNDIDV
tara:strand:+ start:1118 stop:1915 length:798 start_codon:yes stop_codon:yes gene_type:complete